MSAPAGTGPACTRPLDAQLALAIRSSKGGLWDLRLDPENPMQLPDYCDISDSLKELIGFPPDEFPDSLQAFRERVLPQDRHLMDQEVAAHLEGRVDHHDMEYRLRHRDGSVRWFRSCGQVLRDDAGRPVRWIGIEWDVTERCRREEELSRSEKKFAALFALSPEPIALLTFPEGRFLEVNRAFLRQLGLGLDEVVGHHDLELGLWRDRRVRRELIRRVLRDGHCEDLLGWIRVRQGEMRAIEITAARLLLDGEDCLLVAGRDVTSELAAEEELLSKAFYDLLTGLPNRAMAEERLGRMVESPPQDGRRTAVLFIDLDRLKTINDSLGHHAGDEVLLATAQRLRDSLRPKDFLARFGGDELVAVLEVSGEEEAVRIGQRLLEGLCHPLEVAGTTIYPTASIGVAVSDENTRQPWDLVRFADIAMYRAKRGAGNALQVFDGDVKTQEVPDLTAEGDLHLAIERNELEVVYQPIVRLDDLSVWGAEALLRWYHPTRGSVPPAEFIPLAEATGLILSIGRWVLERACGQAAAWLQDGVVEPDFMLNVNVSARQLQVVGFAEQVAAVLRESGLPAANLQLELTERVALQAPAGVQTLKALGVGLAIDDFGEGYASLSYLRKLTADCLKVDRGFTRGLVFSPVDRSLVRTVIYLADSLDLRVVAEGVETPEQLRCLRQMGCRLGQGFLFAEPLTATQLAEAARGCGRRQPQPAASAARVSATLLSSSSAENGLDRNGGSPPSLLPVARAASR